MAGPMRLASRVFETPVVELDNVIIIFFDKTFFSTYIKGKKRHSKKKVGKEEPREARDHVKTNFSSLNFPESIL